MAGMVSLEWISAIRLPMQSEGRQKAVGGRNWLRLSKIQDSGTDEFPSQQLFNCRSLPGSLE